MRSRVVKKEKGNEAKKKCKKEINIKIHFTNKPNYKTKKGLIEGRYTQTAFAISELNKGFPQEFFLYRGSVNKLTLL